MRPLRTLAFSLSLLLLSCQPSAPDPLIRIIDGDEIISLHTQERIPLAILGQAGLALGPEDRLFLDGLPSAPDQPVTDSPARSSSLTLQIRRAVPVVLETAGGKKEFQSSAFTIGEALQEASIGLHAGDRIDPPLDAPLPNAPITLSPARDLTVMTNGRTLQIKSSAPTVGEALAEAGILLIGLDYSLPAEKEAPPSDGRIRVVRVNESVLLAQKPIPFESDLQASADVPLDQTQILQPGANGLSMQRIRIRYEDGQEVSRLTEAETLVRPPQTRILAYGTKVEVKTAVVDGVEIQYWRAVQMYATSYSPCRSGSEKCYPGTSSGKPLKKGVVGLRYDWYLNMQGQRLYIPGYGFASVEDVCGGCVGRPWIDLGYSDSDYEQWSSWVTVYFLAPVPANVIYVLE